MRVLYIYPFDEVGDINVALDAGNKLQSKLQQIFDDVTIITEYDNMSSLLNNYIKNVQKIPDSDIIIIKQSKTTLSRYNELFTDLLKTMGNKFFIEKGD